MRLTLIDKESYGPRSIRVRCSAFVVVRLVALLCLQPILALPSGVASAQELDELREDVEARIRTWQRDLGLLNLGTLAPAAFEALDISNLRASNWSPAVLVVAGVEGRQWGRALIKLLDARIIVTGQVIELGHDRRYHASWVSDPHWRSSLVLYREVVREFDKVLLGEHIRRTVFDAGRRMIDAGIRLRDEGNANRSDIDHVVKVWVDVDLGDERASLLWASDGCSPILGGVIDTMLRLGGLDIEELAAAGNLPCE